MSNRTHTHRSKSSSNHNIAARIGRWSVQHRRKAILGWLAFVFAALVIGFNVVPQKEIEQNTGMPGESGKAGEVLNDAFPKKSGEQVLIQSKTLKASDSQFKDAVADVSQRLHRVEGVIDIEAGPGLEGRPLGARGVQPQGRPGGHEQDGGELARRRQRSRQGASGAPHRRGR